MMEISINMMALHPHPASLPIGYGISICFRKILIMTDNYIDYLPFRRTTVKNQSLELPITITKLLNI